MRLLSRSKNRKHWHFASFAVALRQTETTRHAARVLVPAVYGGLKGRFGSILRLLATLKQRRLPVPKSVSDPPLRSISSPNLDDRGPEKGKA